MSYGTHVPPTILSDLHIDLEDCDADTRIGQAIAPHGEEVEPEQLHPGRRQRLNRGGNRWRPTFGLRTY